MRRFLVFILVLLHVGKSTSQSVKIYAYPRADTVQLIWLPDGIDVWQDGIDQGFNLYRSTIVDNGHYNSIEEQESSKVFIGKYDCKGKDDWMKSLDTTNQWEVLAAGMVYGDFEEVPSSSDYKLSSMVDNEMGESNRYLFNIIGASNSQVAAEKMGYTHTEPGLVSGNIYQYDITLGESAEIIGTRIVQAGRKPEWRKVEPLQIENESNGIVLRWGLIDEYINYSIYRSENGARWEMINDVPVMTIDGVHEGTYLDQDVEAGIEYQYRLRGKTIFGLWGPYSEVKGIERKVEPEEGSLIFTSFEEKEQGLNLGWRYEGAAQLRNVEVLYAEAYDGPFRELSTTKNTEELKIEIKEALNSGYIQLVGKDEYGRKIRSIKRLYNPIDVTPPYSPQELICGVDTLSNHVFLNWAPCDDSGLLGYRVYFSNQKDGNYLDMGQGVMDSSRWILPVKHKTNGSSLFFKVQAIDLRYNASNLGEACEVVLPDRRPPAAPLIRKIKDLGSDIEIEWAISPSRDVVEHIIEKRDDESRDWAAIKVSESLENIQVALDTSVKQNLRYHYRIGAIDKGGNTTYSDVRSGSIVSYEYKMGAENLNAKIEENSLILSWNTVPPGALKRIIIYRSINGGDVISYKTISQQEIRGMVTYDKGVWTYQFKDSKVSTGKSYQYSVRMVWQDGLTSKKSGEITIRM